MSGSIDPAECARCRKPYGQSPHECTWQGGPRPIGLSRDRINVQGIDKRVMVRLWAIEGAKTRRTASRRHRQQGRHMIDRYTKGRAYLCVGSTGGEDRLVVMFDEALRHEAEEWANATRKPAERAFCSQQRSDGFIETKHEGKGK